MLMRLHDWLYEIVGDLCYDREYLYTCFVQHFTGLCQQIFREGRYAATGRYEIPGLKSNKTGILEWQLDHCVNLMGSNFVTITYDEVSGGQIVEAERRSGRFELSTGDRF